MKEESDVEVKEYDEIFCTSCGKAIKKEAFVCPHCGVKNKATSVNKKNKFIPILLAIFLGSFGTHKFYLKRRVSGISRLAICLMSVFIIVAAFIYNASLPDHVWENNISPIGILFGALAILLLQIIAFIEGIILLCMSKDKFNAKYNNKHITLVRNVGEEQYIMGTKKHDEKYCTSCGKIIKKEAFVCPHCGVKTGERGNEKSKTLAGVLAILLGAFGIHKFYLRKHVTGILYLSWYLVFTTVYIIAIVTFENLDSSSSIWYFLPSELITLSILLCLIFIQNIIAFIDGIILLCMSNDKFDEKYNKKDINLVESVRKNTDNQTEISKDTYCTSCGKAINELEEVCPYCSVKTGIKYNSKSRIVAGVLAIFLGALGVHKFYLGKPLKGVLYIVINIVCFIITVCIFTIKYAVSSFETEFIVAIAALITTLIIPIISFIEGIILLCMSDDKFDKKYSK